VDDDTDFVITNALSPTEVCNCIVGTFASGVTFSLESISANGTARESGVASSIIDGICSMAKVIDTGMGTFLVISNMVSWRSREAKATSSQCFGESLKCDSGQSKGQTKKRSDDTSE